MEKRHFAGKNISSTHVLRRGEESGEKRRKSAKGEAMKSLIVENKLVVVLIMTTFKLISEIITREIELGPCYLQYLEPCANNSIQFFLFTSDRPNSSPILLDNISPELPLDYNQTITKNFKMIIHGYGGHLDFNGSKQIRKGRLRLGVNLYCILLIR